MDLQYLRYFQTVVKEGKLTRAAEKLYLSQPALSGMISRLEKELGIKLFDRTSRQMILNEYGKALLPHVEKILEEYDAALQSIQHLKNKNTGELSIAVTGMAFPHFFINNFLSAYPTIHIKQTFVPVDEIADTLRRMDIDFVISAYPCQMDDVLSYTIWEENICVAVPADHFASGENSISLKNLAQEKFIALPKGQAFRRLTDDLCSHADFQPVISVESFPGQIASLVRKGQGIALIPESAVLDGEYDGTHILHLIDAQSSRKVSLLWLRSMELRNSAKIFLKFVQTTYPGNGSHRLSAPW